MRDWNAAPSMFGPFPPQEVKDLRAEIDRLAALLAERDAEIERASELNRRLDAMPKLTRILFTRNPKDGRHEWEVMPNEKIGGFGRTLLDALRVAKIGDTK